MMSSGPIVPASIAAAAVIDLEGRARLVGVGDRPAAARLGARVRVAVRVERRDGGHREDLARPRVEDDGGGRPGVRLLPHPRELALGDVLEAGVERQPERGPLDLVGRPPPAPSGAPRWMAYERCAASRRTVTRAGRPRTSPSQRYSSPPSPWLSVPT